MNAEEFFKTQLITDANSVIDINAHKYSRSDLLRFAEAYHEARMKDELIDYDNYYSSISSQHYMDSSDEQIIDEYLATRKNK